MKYPLLLVILMVTLVSLSPASKADVPCDCNNALKQSDQLKAISEHLKPARKRKRQRTAKWTGAVKSWPESMQNSQASWYGGTPDYARNHNLKYWAATPLNKNIAFGICLMVTSKKDPSRHVAVTTADTGAFGFIPHRYLDLSKSASAVLGNKGTMDVTATQVDTSVCESQNPSHK